MGDFITPRIKAVPKNHPSPEIKSDTTLIIQKLCEKPSQPNSESSTQSRSECPMTGDPSTDREILNFIRKREAVFRKINEEKLVGRSMSDIPPLDVEKPQKIESALKSEP